MLGRIDLKATRVHTHIEIGQLQEIHRATHPANLQHERHALQPAIDTEDDAASDNRL